MAAFSDDINRLLEVLFHARSWTDTIRGRDRREECLEQLAAAADVRVVPLLVPVAAAEDALSIAAARTIARLVHGISPFWFAWVDQEVRRQSYDYRLYDAWRTFSPEAVSRLSRTGSIDPVVIGLFGSHRNGFVRAAVLEYLAGIVDGREIPLLALRANDWVAPVAVRAAQLLMPRLRPENRDTILATLPFLIRMLGASRRDHRELRKALTSALLADGGDAALRRAGSFDTGVRRQLYDLLDAGDADAHDAGAGDAAGHVSPAADEYADAGTCGGHRRCGRDGNARGLTNDHAVPSTRLGSKDFNRSQIAPRADQVLRIHRLLDCVGGRLPPDTTRLMRLSAGSL